MTAGNIAAPGSPSAYVLAIDIGTSSARALLFDGQGDPVRDAHAQRTYPLTTNEQGEVSVDADQLLEVVCACVDEALAAAGERAKHIIAVACDTFWHSFLAVDDGGRPLTPVITWADTRAREASASLRRELDPAAIHERTGAPLHTSYWPARLRWLAQSQPDTFKHAASFISFGEYLHHRVLGRSVCSLCMASGTGLLTTQARSWDQELIQFLGIRLEQLPPLGDLRDALRGLTPEFASRWPALRDVPWFPAIGDGAAANIGSGCGDVRRVALTVGTSSAVRVITPVQGTVAPDGLWLYLLDANRAVLGGALSEGGNLLAWLERTVKITDLASAEQDAAQVPPDSHGLTILPFLAGERSLGWHGAARATIAGVSVHTTPAEILRAALESLAYRIATVYQRLTAALATPDAGPQPAREVIGSGGSLLSSPLFQQIIADTLGIPLHPSRDTEASARGAALLALQSLGRSPHVAAIAPRTDPPVQPDSSRAAIYHKAMRRQEDLYRRLLD